MQVATMSMLNSSRHHGHYSYGHISGLELIIITIVVLYIAYILGGVLLGLIFGEYTTKRNFILDLLIPFRGLYRVIANCFKELN